MTGKRLIPLALAVLVASAIACQPKPPAAPADDGLDRRTTVDESRPTDVTPPPRTTPRNDVEESPIPRDIQQANDYVHTNGLIGDVFYEFDSSTLSADARDRIAKNATFMKEHPEFVFTIEGHCDERGTNEYNLALGERRATAARDYLGSLGVSGRARTISYGEERPQCTESTDECWQRNRRAYFRITGKTR